MVKIPKITKINKNDHQKPSSYFLVDNTGRYFVEYLDNVLNSNVQFVWKNPLKEEEQEEQEEQEDNNNSNSWS